VTRSSWRGLDAVTACATMVHMEGKMLDDEMKVRLPADVKRRLMEYAERRDREQPGYRLSDAVREAVVEKLRREEVRDAG
jgi:hypothetical protein